MQDICSKDCFSLFVSDQFAAQRYLSLCWEEIVDFAAGGKCVHTITQKTKTEDIIPISDEALELIGYSPEKKGLVFKGLKRSWTQQPMKEWIRSAGLPKT